MVDLVKKLIDWELVGADELDYSAGVVRCEAFFEVVDAVVLT